MNLMSILVFSMFGPNVFSYACTRIDLYLGIALFSAFQAYDTQFAVEAYKNGQFDHLSQVLKFFLNFSNLFVRVLQALGRSNDNR
jgi:FtsH-binding integral membrane protein